MKTNTKIIATLGPSCSDPKVIDQMINNGANIFRLNMSHGDRDSKIKLYDLLKGFKLKRRRKTYYFNRPVRAENKNQ